jgi:hypothetical protein
VSAPRVADGTGAVGLGVRVGELLQGAREFCVRLGGVHVLLQLAGPAAAPHDLGLDLMGPYPEKTIVAIQGREVDTLGQPAVEDPADPADTILGLPVGPIGEIPEGGEAVVARTLHGGHRKQLCAAALEAVSAIHEG